MTHETSKDGVVTHLEMFGSGESSVDHQFVDENDEAVRRGAAIIEHERTLSVWETVRLHKRALAYSCISFAAALAFGYDTVVNGASIAMPSFLIYFGEFDPVTKSLYLPSKWTSLWTAMSAACQALGAFAVGFGMDRFGRTWPASMAGAVTVAGTAMQYTAQSRGLLLAGKMVNGLGIGVGMACATTYASEIAPLKLRGTVQSALVLFTIFMQGLALGLVRIFVPNIAPQAFRNVFAIQWVVGVILMVSFAFAPESPIFFITNNRLDRAHTAMSRIYGNEKSVDARVAHLIKTVREEEAHNELHRGTYFECFKDYELKRTLTVMFLYSSANFGGAAFLSQSIYFLIIAGLPAIHAFDVSIGGFGLAMIIIVSSWFVMNLFRRRSAFAAGLVLNFIMMLIIGCLYYAKGTGPLWAIAILMNLLISFQTSLLQAMGWPIAAEISSLRLRAKTLSIGVIAQTLSTWVTLFTVPYMYNIDAGNLGARTGFVFVGFSIVLMIGAIYLVPDTTGLTTEEIDHLYAKKVAPRHFQKHVGKIALGRQTSETTV